MNTRKYSYDMYLLQCRCGYEYYTNIIKGLPHGISKHERICLECGSICQAKKVMRPDWKLIGDHLVREDEL